MEWMHIRFCCDGWLFSQGAKSHLELAGSFYSLAAVRARGISPLAEVQLEQCQEDSHVPGIVAEEV